MTLLAEREARDRSGRCRPLPAAGGGAGHIPFAFSFSGLQGIDLARHPAPRGSALAGFVASLALATGAGALVMRFGWARARPAWFMGALVVFR